MDDLSRATCRRVGSAVPLGFAAAIVAALVAGHGRLAPPDCAAAAAAAADTSRFTAQLDSIAAIVDAGDLAVGESAARRFLRDIESAFGRDTPEQAQAQWLLARCLSQRGQGAGSQADSLVEASLRTLGRTAGPTDLRLAQSLDLKGLLLRESGDLPGAQQIAERVLAIREERLGPDHWAVGKALNALAVIHLKGGRLEQGRAYLERAYRVVQQARGPNHRDTGALALNLGSLNFQLGQYREARRLYEQALAILERALGPDHPSVAAGVQGLANVASITGDYDQARRLNARSLEIRTQRLGPDHPDVADVLLNMAILERLLGDFGAAEQHVAAAVAILERGAAAQGPSMAAALTILGDLRFCTEQLADAQRELERSLALHERIGGRQGAEAGNVLMQLCKVKHARGQLAAAQADGEEGLACLRASLDDANPYVAQAKALLAQVVLDRGDAGRATALLQEAVAAMDSVAADHPSTAWEHRELGDALARAGHPAEAFAQWSRAERISRRHVALTAHTLSEGKALAYRRQQKRPLTRMLEHVATHPQAPPEQVRAAWDAVIRSRSVLLDEAALRTQMAFAGDDAGSLALFQALAAARSDLANLYLKTVPGKGSGPYRAALEQAQHEKERLEIELARASAAFARQQGREQIGLAQVQRALPPRSALLSFVAYQKRDGDVDRPAYLAFLSRADRHGASVVRLDADGRLHEAWEAWQREIEAGALASGPLGLQADERCRQAGARLRAIVWDPVASLLDGVRDVYIVPDGVLLGLSFGALPTAGGAYLAEGDRHLRLLTTERDLVTDRPRPAAGGLLAVGAPDFDAAVARVAADRQQDPPGAVLAGPLAPALGGEGSSAVLRGARPDCEDLAAMRFRALPNAASEAAALFAEWRKSVDGAPDGDLLLTGVDASESILKQRAPGKRFLHLATHGFFLGSACGRAEPDLSEDERQDDVVRIRTGVAATSPLLLSGVALAGANRRRDPFIAEDDGILTAEEVASLDLRGTELVVLSACETGLGKVVEGEGVFGLRRAFAAAGVPELVMSLWAVDDRSTRELMEALYDARFAQRQDTSQALRTAQLRVLERRRAQGLSTHPYFWAGFVATESGRSTNSPTSD